MIAQHAQHRFQFGLCPAEQNEVKRGHSGAIGNIHIGGEGERIFQRFRIAAGCGGQNDIGAVLGDERRDMQRAFAVAVDGAQVEGKTAVQQQAAASQFS